MSRFFRAIFTRRNALLATGTTLLSAGAGYAYLNSGPAYPLSTAESRRPPPPWTPPTRDALLKALKASGRITTINGKEQAPEEFDLLVVGGGATGSGVAVDAASRGLKVALVERDDFSSGTSSKSTKLVHGGVRYLQKAVFELDYDQYKLVREALHERRIFLETAPYLSSMLPIMLPIYKYWQVPYFYAGVKAYDILASGSTSSTPSTSDAAGHKSSYVMSKSAALAEFPMLKADGLVGAVVYYDGQHNDSRMNMALIMSAVREGAVVTNYTEVTELHKNDKGKLNGARIKDTRTGEEFNVRAKGIINATGPFTDALLTLDNPAHKPIVQASSGIHVTLPNYYSPRTMGLLDPSTSDGRVIFFLPWQGGTIAGTTDSPSAVTTTPVAQEEEIRWVLDEIRRYLSPDIRVRRGDVLSAWSGLRPLVRDPKASSTEGLVRNHMIHVSDSGLVTIAGGKWTTYRCMAQETVDEAIKVFGLRLANGDKVGKCATEKLKLVGSAGWGRGMYVGLIQRFGLETEVAKHLSDNYGDRAWTVASLANATGESWPLHGIRLSEQYPYIEAEVRYAVQHEYALTPVDVLARRTRLSFLNVYVALDVLPRVVDIMAEELNWSRAQKATETERAIKFMETMGIEPPTAHSEPLGFFERAENALRSGLGASLPVRGTRPVVFGRAQFEKGEVDALQAAFMKRSEGKDEVKKIDVLPVLREVLGYGYERIGEKDTAYVLEEAGFKSRATMNFNEFVEMCASLKDVSFAPAPTSVHRKAIPVEKSGGGV